jgi:hypothetical protein
MHASTRSFITSGTTGVAKPEMIHVRRRNDDE